MSEETEVRDIEWLKKEFDDLFNGKSILTVGKSVVDEILDQLDKTEVKNDLNWFKEQLDDIEMNTPRLSSHDSIWMLDRVNELLSQLDKTEVLSQAWIDKNVLHVRGLGDIIKAEAVENLFVPKQELPVIPPFIAETIEKDKEAGYHVYDSIYLIIETNGGGIPSISDWVAKNIDKYARAWLNGYEVEEQKYVVKIPTNENNDIPYAIVSDSGDIWIDALPSKYKLTEEEIRGLTKGDVLFEHFAVKVEVWDE